MNTTDIFLLGCAGAAAPEIVRVWRLRSHTNLKFSWKYVLVSALFFSLGGLVATILPATTPWAAFYAGVAAPTLVSRIAAHTTRRRATALPAHETSPAKRPEDELLSSGQSKRVLSSIEYIRLI